MDTFTRSLYQSFSFENMRVVAEVIFFPIRFYRKIYFIENLLQNFVFSFFILLSRMFPWMNKFLFTGNSFLPRLIKKEVYK